MRCPSRITVVLLATGIPPVAFTIALFVLGSIPDNIAPALTIAFVLIPMAVFLPVFAFVGFRDVARRTRRHIGGMKTVLSHCPICDAGIPHTGLRDLRRAKREHLETIHPDFSRYEKKMGKFFVVPYWAGLSVLTVVSIVFLSMNDYILSLARLSVIIAGMYASNRILQRQVKGFRRR